MWIEGVTSRPPAKRAGQAGQRPPSAPTAPPRAGSYLEDRLEPPTPLSQRNSYPFEADGTPIPALLPDTLYSWLDPWISRRLFARTQVSEFFKPRVLDRGMHFSRTPAASFGYGYETWRGKLKDGVKFVPVPLRVEPPQNAIQRHGQAHDLTHTVFVRQLPPYGFVEYVAYSPHVFDSVSFATPEGLRELESEVAVIDGASDQEQYDLVIKTDGDLVPLTPARLRQGVDFDRRHWRLSALHERVEHLRGVVSSERGNVLIGPAGEVDRAEHFSTHSRPYWTTQDDVVDEGASPPSA